MLSLNYKKNLYLLYALIFISLFSFFIGFSNNEIPMGSGGENGDINFVKKSIEIFSNNSLIDSINLYGNSSNRPPLIYILNNYLNPYFKNIESYRSSVFFISLIIPIFLFFALKKKFKNTNNHYLFFLTCTVFLNPIYRNSSFWGLEENYAYGALFISLYFLQKIKPYKKNQFKIENKNLFLLTFFSSLCIYFDQKFIIIPLFIFLKLIFSEIKYGSKINLIFFYFLFSLPFLYLIVLWKGIFPSDIYHIGKNYYLDHVIYTPSILAFCALPFVILESNFSFYKIKKIFLNRKFILFLFIILLFIFYFNFFYDNSFLNNLNDGGGIMKKLSNMFFDSPSHKKKFVYISFLISSIILFYFIEFKIINFLLIFYYLAFSMLVNPFFQEYFEPLIIFIFIFFFIKKYEFTFNRLIFFYLYNFIYLIASINYYSYVL